MGANLTNAWANTKSSYGLGGMSNYNIQNPLGLTRPSGWSSVASQSQPMMQGLGVQAAGMGIGALIGNPLVGAILAQVGGNLLEKVFGGGASPYEQFQKQSMGALQQQLPIIQAQARGVPSAATQAQLAALRQQTTRAQQSYGSTALGRNVGQSTPTKATQARFRTAETQAAGQIAGNAQLTAQQQLMQLGTAGAAGMQQIEMQEAANRRQIYGDIGTIMGEYRAAQQQKALDPEMQDVFKMLKDVMRNVASSFVKTGGNNG